MTDEAKPFAPTDPVPARSAELIAAADARRPLPNAPPPERTADRPPPGIRTPSPKVEPAGKPEPSGLQKAIAQARRECGCLGCAGRQKPTLSGHQRTLNGGHPMGCVAAPVLAHLLAQGGQP